MWLPAIIAIGLITTGVVATSAEMQQGSEMQRDVLGKDEGRAILERYLERMSAPKQIQAASLEDWKPRRDFVREKVLYCLGLDPLPERVPLRPVYGGTLDRDGYTLRRVYFQTWPNVYASGWLYIPNAPGQHPAVLNPVGHWPDGAMNPVVQSRCIGLAKKGYVALAMDAEHLHPSGGTLRDYTGKPFAEAEIAAVAPCQCYPKGHGSVDAPGFDFYSLGLSATAVQTWNNIRGIDFLDSMPEVDSSRIGCTGASGGGLQTLYMMAVDDRVKAAVPVVYVAYFNRFINYGEGGHCICNFVPSLLRHTDQPEIAATFAPRPALFLSVTGDWEKDFPKEEFPEIQDVYRLYGAEDRVGCEQWDIGHDYAQPMRERMYAWFNKYLKGIHDPVAAREPEIVCETITTMSGLNSPPPSTRPLEPLTDGHRASVVFTPPDPGDAVALKGYLGTLRDGLSDLLGDVQVAGKSIGETRTVEFAGFQAEAFRVRSEPEIDVPVLLFRPEVDERLPVVILLHPNGKRGVLEKNQDLLRLLLTGGAAVLLPDVRLTGELSRKWYMNTVLWGRPEAGMALTDMRACLDVLSARQDLDGGRVAVVGLGGAGGTALILGALEPRFKVVAAEHVGISYSEGRWLPLIPNILRLGDLSQIAAAVAPRRIILGGVVEPVFDFTRQAYETMDAGSRYRLQKPTYTPSKLAANLLLALAETLPEHHAPEEG